MQAGETHQSIDLPRPSSERVEKPTVWQRNTTSVLECTATSIGVVLTWRRRIDLDLQNRMSNEKFEQKHVVRRATTDVIEDCSASESALSVPASTFPESSKVLTATALDVSAVAETTFGRVAGSVGQMSPAPFCRLHPWEATLGAQHGQSLPVVALAVDLTSLRKLLYLRNRTLLASEKPWYFEGRIPNYRLAGRKSRK